MDTESISTEILHIRQRLDRMTTNRPTRPGHVVAYPVLERQLRARLATLRAELARPKTGLTGPSEDYRWDLANAPLIPPV